MGAVPCRRAPSRGREGSDGRGGLVVGSGRMNNSSKDAERPEPASSLEGQRIDKYEVVRLVGRGGMGAVYEARNTSINKRVAMKCIDASLARNEEANARFQREALAASAIESPHIVQIFDAGATADGMPYIVMELLQGRDLGRCLAEVGRLEVADALHIVGQALRGLRRAHAAGIIHRDLKPDNLFLVEREDEPYALKILDFGVSKFNRAGSVPLKTLTQQGSVVGTPYYMSPEQAQAYPDIDARADIYSVGAILYECLTGRPPHVGQAYEQVIVNICMKDAADVRDHNASVPESIARLLTKALSRDRDDRYGSAQEMLDALIEHAPPELRSEFRSAPSGMRRISLGSSSPASAEPADGADEPVAARDGDDESSTLPTGGPLADTVRADSGMMSVASPPSEPPTVPMGSSDRRWPLALVVAGGLALGGGAVVLTALGEPESTGADPRTGPALTTTAAHEEFAPPSAPASQSTPPGAGGTGPGTEDDAGPSALPRSPTAAVVAPRPPSRPPARPPSGPTATAVAPALPSVTGATSQPNGLPLLRD